jgi:hypothetical protein
VRFWWQRFGPMIASEIRCKRMTSIYCDPIAAASRGGRSRFTCYRGNDRGHPPLPSPLKGEPP